MNHKSIVGVDLGGTNVRAGLIIDNQIVKIESCSISSSKPEAYVLEEVIATIDKIFENDVAGIGVGVPSVVDTERGIVYDVQNIPSWKEVHLKQKLEDYFKVPVYINNDANCFAIGERYFGHGSDYKNIVGLISGTGLAAGIIINGKLYDGYNCGAGEFGMIPYKDHNYEYYCSGQYFAREHQIPGDKLFQMASNGEQEALDIFKAYGANLGNAIKTILYSIDPEIIILGGSVSKAYSFFEDTLSEKLQSFAYTPVVDRLTIRVSENPHIAMLGAAALYFDKRDN